MDLLYWIWLSRIAGINDITRNKLRLKYYTSQKIFEASYEDLLSKGFSRSEASAIVSDHSLLDSEAVLQACSKEGISVVCFSDILFPHSLRNLNCLPQVLYYKGDLKALNESFGKVRRARLHAKNCDMVAESCPYSANIPSAVSAVISPAEHLKTSESYMIREVSSAASSGHLIASEIRKRTDPSILRCAISHGAFSVAVLSCGFQAEYSGAFTEMIPAILNNGVIISDISPLDIIHPRSSSSAAILAGLADNLIAIQPTRNSSAMAAARYAAAFGRTVKICGSRDLVLS